MLGIFLIALKSYLWAFFGHPSERESIYLLCASLVACLLTPLVARGLFPGRLHSVANYNYTPPWVEQFARVLTLLFLLALVLSLWQLRHGYPTTMHGTGYFRHTGRGATIPIGVDEYWSLQRAVVRIFFSFTALIGGRGGLSLWFHWEPPSRRDSLL
jgi:hypothetical protein